jgi:hypothetical protein
VSVLGDGRFVQNPGAHCHRLDLAVRLLDDRDFHDSLQLQNVKKQARKTRGQLLETDGSSRIQGHIAIVLTLPFVFLMTVIFMSDSLWRAMRADAFSGDGDSLPQVVDDHIHQPGAERAVLFRVLRGLVFHFANLLASAASPAAGR